MKRPLIIAISLMLLLCGAASAQTGNIYPGYGPIAGGAGVAFTQVGAGYQLTVTGAAPTSLTFGATSIPLSGTAPTNTQFLCMSGGSLGGCAPTGLGTVTSVTGAVNGPIVTSTTTTPVITTPTNTWFAQNYSGATADVKIASCLSAASATTGVCDATGLTGAQSIAATIVIPSHATLLLGAATYTSAVSPAIQYGANHATLIGAPSGKYGNGPSKIQLAGGVTGGTLVDMATNDPSYPTIENMFLVGISAADSSIGIDLSESTYATIENDAIAVVGTALNLGGTSQGTYYAVMFGNVIGGAISVGESFGLNANKDISISDHFQGSGTAGTFYGWQFLASEGADVVISPDCEAAGSVCFDINSNSLSIYDPYIEGANTGIKFESSAQNTTITGAGAITSTTTPINYNGVNAATAYDYIFLTNPGGPTFPQFFGSFLYYIGVGGSLNFVTLDAPSTLGPKFLYTPGSQAETTYGETGGAALQTGADFTTGGIIDTGKITTAALGAPTGLTCTATCVPGACATTYTYAVVCHDYAGGLTTRSASATCSNNATLDASDFNTLAWTKQPGCQLWDIVGNLDLTHSVAVNQQVGVPGSIGTPGTTYSYKDTNNSPSAYTPPPRNSTPDLTLPNGAVANYPCVAVSSLPAAGTNTDIQNGSAKCVNNWNGTTGVCTAGSPNLSVIAVYDTTNTQWDCP